MIASLLIMAIGYGVVFAWTRSLVPSIVAHAIVNVPMTPLWQGVLFTMFVIGAVVMGRRGVAIVKEVFSRAPVVACLALTAVGTAYAIASERVESLVFAATAMVVVAVALEAIDRRAHHDRQPDIDLTRVDDGRTDCLSTPADFPLLARDQGISKMARGW